MKSIRFFALLAVMLLPLLASAQTKTFNRTVALSPGGNLRVNTDIGTLRLTAWERPEVEISARIIARSEENARAEAVQRGFESASIEVTGGGSAVTIKANYGNENDYGVWNIVRPRIEWEIRAPRQANLDLNVDRSEAEVRGFEGNHRMHSDRTVLRVEDLAGDIRLEIDRGAESQLGRVRGRVTVTSDRTNLTFAQLQLTGDSTLNLNRGNIELQFARAQGLSLAVNRDRRSSFKSDFPLAARDINEGRIEEPINGGGPRLTIETDRAQVYLRNN